MSPHGKDTSTTTDPVPELKVPKWLNEQFFYKILKKDYGENVIKDFSVAAALGKGENYTSIIFRVKIIIKTSDNEDEQASYIVKSGLESDVSDQMVASMALFPKEQEMYNDIIPQFENLLKEAGESVQFSPRCFKTSEDPEIIVLDDLKPQKFVNIRRQAGMDMKHVKVVLDKLAKFHAASACLYEKQGRYSDHFQEGMIKKEMIPMMEQMLLQMWPCIRTSLSQIDDFEKYLEKMDNQQKRSVDLILKSTAIDPNEFNVLNHGDLWANNIMFKYNDDGSIAEVKFVDLQLCYWGSPVQDLQYFIMSSCNPEIRIKEFDYILKYYHDQLMKSLELLKYPKIFPKLIDLHIQVHKRGYFGLHSALSILPAVLMEPNEYADLDNFLQESESSAKMKMLMFSNPSYLKSMQALMPFFDDRGILDM